MAAVHTLHIVSLLGPILGALTSGLVVGVCVIHTCDAEFDVVRRELRHTRRYLIITEGCVRLQLPCLV
jgi:hypothetical protein